MEKTVVCVGEILWDVLPKRRLPGGAPMNVAYHLRRLGVESQLVSRVGQDHLGEELTTFLNRMGLPTSFIQQDHRYATGQAIASIEANHEVHYEIVQPVAWDYLQSDKQVERLVENSAILLFGSLVARNEVARNTLCHLLEKAKYRLFDVNLRPPHYTKETILYLLERAHAVKVNHHELRLIGQWLGCKSEKEPDNVAYIQKTYTLEEFIVTKGAKGVSYYTADSRYDYPAYPITVVDTIGSGDSFLAAFVAQKIKQVEVEDMLDYAAALGAFVTSKDGANPDYTAIDLNRFIWEKKLENARWK